MLVVKKRGKKVLSEHSLLFKNNQIGHKLIKMKKIQHESFFIQQGMIQIYNFDELQPDEHYLIQIQTYKLSYKTIRGSAYLYRRDYENYPREQLKSSTYN